MTQVPLRTFAGQQVEVRRSTRRRRTVSAHREGDRIVVLLPARTSRADEARWVEELVGKIVRREQRTATGAGRSDTALLRRARELNTAYLGGRAVPAQVRWVGPLRSRWASCTPADRSIRVSERVRAMPPWVLDYVLVHELAHLLEPGHGPRFWALVAAYPRTERARGYLDGVSAAAGLGITPDDDDPAAADADGPATDVDASRS